MKLIQYKSNYFPDDDRFIISQFMHYAYVMNIGYFSEQEKTHMILYYTGLSGLLIFSRISHRLYKFDV